jgi:hypothetical protein
LRDYYRRRAGGFSPDMAVKKDKIIEEWNGQREITTETFTLGFAEAPTLIIYVILIPYGMYTWCRSEMLSKDDKRFHDIV